MSPDGRTIDRRVEGRTVAGCSRGGDADEAGMIELSHVTASRGAKLASPSSSEQNASAELLGRFHSVVRNASNETCFSEAVATMGSALSSMTRVWR